MGGGKETDKNRRDGKKRCVKIKGTGRLRRKTGIWEIKFMSLIEEDARRRETKRRDEMKGKKEDREQEKR